MTITPTDATTATARTGLTIALWEFSLGVWLVAKGFKPSPSPMEWSPPVSRKKMITAPPRRFTARDLYRMIVSPQDSLTGTEASVCRTVSTACLARCDLEIGEEGFAARRRALYRASVPVSMRTRKDH